MRNRVAGKALKTVAFTGLLLGTTALAGCSSLGLGMGRGDVTGSISSNASSGGQQAMPQALQPIGVQQVASGPFVPPEDVGGGSSSAGFVTGSAPPSAGTITSSALPPLTESAPRMSAQPNLAPVAAPRTASLGNSSSSSSVTLGAPPQALAPVPHANVSQSPQVVSVSAPVASSPAMAEPASNVSVMPSNAYVHVIESGESLYTVARRYDVTAQAIVQANGMSSPDKIYVGQKIIIPGRPDLLAAKGPAPKVASIDPAAPAAALPSAKAPAALVAPAQQPVAKVAPVQQTAPAAVPQVAKTAPAVQQQAPTQQVATSSPEPVRTTAPAPAAASDKFRWPVSGKVIADFQTSRQTGINIDAPEGTAVRAAENGQVIYVGSGVEGYGNLILIRHSNGYVSAYAHLKSTSVNKGDNVSRGDNLGTVGMTGFGESPAAPLRAQEGCNPGRSDPATGGLISRGDNYCRGNIGGSTGRQHDCFP